MTLSIPPVSRSTTPPTAARPAVSGVDRSPAGTNRVSVYAAPNRPSPAAESPMAAATRRSSLARDFDPHSPSVRRTAVRDGDAEIRVATDGRTRVVETRYPDGEALVEVEVTRGERDLRERLGGVLPTRTHTRVFDAESFRVDAGGEVRRVAETKGARETETVFFESRMLGFRLGVREYSGMNIEVDIDEDGAAVGLGLRGKAGPFLDWRNRDVNIYLTGSLGIGAAARSTRYGAEDGASELSIPGVPVSGSASSIGNESEVEVDFGPRRTISAGVGVHIERDLESLPPIDFSPQASPAPHETGDAAPAAGSPANPAEP